ncbi:MAG: GTPase ObgE [Pseudobdellovibrionaceae bacterium]
MRFIDEVQIHVSSGHGGAGCVSFRRESMSPRGGPDGGDGGKGGSIVFKTSTHINSLVDFRNNKKYSARTGRPGSGDCCTGSDGEDLILVVPLGTMIKNLEGQTLVDMTGLDEFVFLKGGRGGKGNHFFRTSVNQAPEHAQPGEDGESLDVILELKLIADVGIIGFPNAGKSTFISRISAAKPKIADYPFTTLTPNLGVVKVADFKSFVVADIPGLIKGASQGVGLGIQFLKHIERTKYFVHLLDASGYSARSPVDDYLDLNEELRLYDENNRNKEDFFPLSERDQIVVLNKIDTLNDEQVHKIKKEFKSKTGVEPFLISAVTGKNVKELVVVLSQKIFAEEKK